MSIDQPLPACGLGSSHKAHPLTFETTCAGTLDNHPAYRALKARLDALVEQSISKAAAFFQVSRRPNAPDAKEYYFGGHTIAWLLDDLGEIFGTRTVEVPEFEVDREAVLDLTGLAREVENRSGRGFTESPIDATVETLEENADRVLDLLPNVRAAALSSVRALLVAKRAEASVGGRTVALETLDEVLALLPAVREGAT